MNSKTYTITIDTKDSGVSPDTVIDSMLEFAYYEMMHSGEDFLISVE